MSLLCGKPTMEAILQQRPERWAEVTNLAQSHELLVSLRRPEAALHSRHSVRPWGPNQCGPSTAGAGAKCWIIKLTTHDAVAHD